jgi:hypothetical protein
MSFEEWVSLFVQTSLFFPSFSFSLNKKMIIFVSTLMNLIRDINNKNEKIESDLESAGRRPHYMNTL